MPHIVTFPTCKWCGEDQCFRCPVCDEWTCRECLRHTSDYHCIHRPYKADLNRGWTQPSLPL